MAVATAHGGPEGLSVVTVIVTVLPASPAAGVYVNVNVDVTVEDGLTVPAPFVVIATEFALANVLPFTVTGAVPQVLPLMLLSETAGPFTQPHETEKLLPVVVHPETLRTVIVWLPFATLLNAVPV